MPNGQAQMDNDVINLAKAIRQTESGGNFNARGQSGESGAYQWIPTTWKAHAKQALGDENAPMTPSNQNAVAYTVIKSWKDQGLNPAQIAAKWNSGSETGWENKVGVNEHGVKYDVPKYVKSVTDAYQQVKGGAQVGIDPNNPSAIQGNQTPLQYETESPLQSGMVANQGGTSEPNKETLGGALQHRLQQAGSAIGDSASGKQGLISGALQLGGAGAGAILDTTGAALKAIPLVGGLIEGAENLIGKGVTKGFETETGQDILSGYAKFAQENPVAAKNIGSIANMVSVIPLFRGVAVGMGAAKGTLNSAFRGSLEKTAEKELTQTISRVRTGGQKLTDIQGRGLNPIGQIVKDPELLPDIETDAKGIARYNTTNAEQKLSNQIDEIDDRLDVELAKATGTDLGGYVPLEAMKQTVMDAVRTELKGSPDLASALKKVGDDFGSIGMSYGDMVTLNDLNSIKRMVRKSVNFDSPSLDRNVRYHEGQAIMKMIEDVATKRGLENVRTINREMAEKIEAQNLLQKYVHAKSVPENPGWKSLSGKAMEPTTVAAGEAVGQSFGTPLVGGLVGRAIHGAVFKGKKGAVEKIKSTQKATPSLKSQRALLTTSALQAGERGSRETR